jgi:hypothetical protein
MEKTQILSFSRFPESTGTSFDFLGFEFRWEDGRKGKRIVKVRTSRKKFRQSLANFTVWSRKNRDTSISDRAPPNHGRTGRPSTASIFLLAMRKANISEEPVAGKLHDGICAGGTG